ncbi:MAG: cytidylate kinase-like family protein [Propionibacteriaceae bacterium]|nr:cytidylate kinase-like family protein [Propionibacteriaceae bacterium]
MAVITISRQAGSRGARIARGLAKELGWEFADKSTINRVIRQYGLVRLNDLYNELPKLGDLFSDNAALTIEMMNETIAAIAARGNVVILGRGAFAVLKDVADVLNVFVEAPLEARIARIAKRDDTDLETAEERVKADDKLRRRFTRRYYSTNWANPENYDLVVDTGEITDDEAIEQILAALHALPTRAEGSVAEALAVHPVLAQTIDEVMGGKA